jgi:ABC-type lipoprotein release transport system permease subunit
MTYRRVLLGRWSRRDWLAVAVVAVAVAFLVGTVLVVTAAETQTTAIAGEYAAVGTVTTHFSLAEAEAAAGANATVIPFSVVTGHDDQRRYVLGRPTTAATGPSSVSGDDSGVTVATLETETQHRLRGPAGAVTVTVTPRAESKTIPASWYVAPPETVSSLGVSGAFVVHRTPAMTVPETGVPLRTALAFFVFGSRDVLGALWAVAGGSAVLIAVVVYSVTRMTVRDRRKTICAIRATGGTARTLLGTFGLRAAIISTVGVALGYALGVIAVNAAVNLAVFLGLPIALPVTVTARVAGVLALFCLGIVFTGAASGGVAASSTVRGPPLDTAARDDTGVAARLPSRLRLTFLDWRAVVPMAATLSTFVAFVVLVAAIWGVATPLTAAGDATITESDAVHPFASNVPETYAGALRNRGVNASAEILILETRDGQPYAARGVNFSAFASVTETKLVSGRTPNRVDEAIVGADLATTLNVRPGDNITLGGHTRSKFTRVSVVGTFRAPGPYDDQLLVSLATARHLGNKRPGVVQFIRAERLPDGSDGRAGSGIQVANINAPAQIPPNNSFKTKITVQNIGSSSASQQLSVSFGNETVTRPVSLASGEETTLTIPFRTGQPGAYTITAGRVNRSVEVVSRNSIQLVGLPVRAPPDAHLHVRVQTAYGDPVANANVTVGNQTIRTNADGVARVSLGGVGQHTIVAQKSGFTARERVAVRTDTPQKLLTTVQVEPSTPDLLTEPTARIELANPWGEPVVRTVTVTGLERDVQWLLRLDPGETRILTMSLPRRPPGSYDVTVMTNATADAETTYRVIGDKRVAAAIANGGRTGSTGIEQAIETVFGNLRLVLAVILSLAVTMTVGGTTATFAHAVHARRRTIGMYRATGASPGRILRLVLADALRLGVVATVVGLGVGFAALRVLRTAGYLTVFGVRLSPTPSLSLFSSIVGGALALTLLGAGLATLGLLLVAPYHLLASLGGRSPPSESEKV